MKRNDTSIRGNLEIRTRFCSSPTKLSLIPYQKESRSTFHLPCTYACHTSLKQLKKRTDDKREKWETINFHANNLSLIFVPFLYSVSISVYFLSFCFFIFCIRPLCVVCVFVCVFYKSLWNIWVKICIRSFAFLFIPSYFTLNLMQIFSQICYLFSPTAKTGSHCKFVVSLNLLCCCFIFIINFYNKWW